MYHTILANSFATTVRATGLPLRRLILGFYFLLDTVDMGFELADLVKYKSCL